MRLDAFADELARHTHPESAASWDPVGLTLGDPTSEITSIAVCHEVTEEVVATLERDAADLLVTYHPLLFSPQRNLVAGRSVGARAFRLLRANTALLVTHTDFDAAPGGSADALASLFGLDNVEAFGGNAAEAIPDIGRVGTLAGTLADVASLAHRAFGGAGLRVTGNREAQVGRVAVIPGSGGDFIDAAAEVADVIITGDVSHHRAVRASDLGLAIVDPGHIATERPGLDALVSLVREVSGLEVMDLTPLSPQTWS